MCTHRQLLANAKRRNCCFPVGAFWRSICCLYQLVSLPLLLLARKEARFRCLDRAQLLLRSPTTTTAAAATRWPA
jgi:hypothetical protein